MVDKKAIVIALATLSSLAIAQKVRIEQDGRPERIFRPVSGLNAQDIKFLRQAALGDNFEMESAKIALQNGQGQFVHEFAQEMIDDHGMLRNEASETAEQRGVSLSVNMPRELQHSLNHLSNLRGNNFDQAFLKVQEHGHEATIHAMKAEIENGRDQNVKAMAVKELPTVELHYKMLLTHETQMGPTKMSHGI